MKSDTFIPHFNDQTTATYVKMLTNSLLIKLSDFKNQ